MNEVGYHCNQWSNEVNIILMVGNVILYEKQSPDKVLWKSDVCHDPKKYFCLYRELMFRSWHFTEPKKLIFKN